MKRILFRGHDILKNRSAGWADLFFYDYACYLVGKDKGYDDTHVVFPRFSYEYQRWGKLSHEDYHWQKIEFLPWKHYPRGKKVILDEWDEIIDTTQPNSLYGGFPGIAKTARYIYIFFDIYYSLKGVKPFLDVPRDYNGKPYVIFQYRSNALGSFTNERITPMDEFKYIYDTVKEHLGNKYEYWKMGEPCSMDSCFDRIVPSMYHDIDGFMKILRNSSLVVGSHSGPPSMAYFFKDVPVIQFGLLPHYIPTNRSFLITEVGESILNKYNIKYHPSWCDDNLIYSYKGKPPSEEKIIDLLDRFKL